MCTIHIHTHTHTKTHILNEIRNTVNLKGIERDVNREGESSEGRETVRKKKRKKPTYVLRLFQSIAP